MCRDAMRTEIDRLKMASIDFLKLSIYILKVFTCNWRLNRKFYLFYSIPFFLAIELLKAVARYRISFTKEYSLQ